MVVRHSSMMSSGDRWTSTEVGHDLKETAVAPAGDKRCCNSKPLQLRERAAGLGEASFWERV